MRDASILLIRESIELARKTEAQTHELQQYLSVMLPSLHKSISLPSEAPSSALLLFVIRYIENVPNSLEALSAHMKDANIYEEGEVFLNIASDFFVSPPEVTQNHSGLHALIDEAYLAHRLFEEVNDRLLMLCGAPLIPMDMTRSNIIVHDVLGEAFANQLDLAVHYVVEALFKPENMQDNPKLSAFVAQHGALSWHVQDNFWPCMTEGLEVDLKFKYH